MDLFEAIERRHSYRGTFSPKPVKREDLEKILKAGLMAPSGKNAQTTQFVIIDDPQLLQKIGTMHTMKAMHSATAMIACIVDTHPEATYEGFAFPVEDCAAAVENILLALTALGYAAAWIDGWLRLNHRAQVIGDLLGLPSGKVVRVLLPIGVPAEPVTAPQKKSFEQRAWFNRYGGN